MYLALGVPRGKNKGLNLNLNGWISFQPAGGLLIGNIKSRNIMFGLQSVYAQLNQGLINISHQVNPLGQFPRYNQGVGG